MIPFSPPRIDQKIIDEVTAALNSGWITTGPRTKLLEKKVADYCSADTVLCLNSASAGLELVLRWFGVGPGDEVILPAYTYAATANVVIHCGAIPVFVDVSDDFCINLNSIKENINANTKVIMPVDIAGWPCDYDQINELVNSNAYKKLFVAKHPNQKLLNRILVLSDAAHSLGAEYKGKKTGVLTDITVFSFHAVKNLTTAEGGAIALNLPKEFNHAEVYKELNTKSLHGQNKDALAKTQIGNWRYDIVEAGYKCNMTDVHAAIGLVEIERYESEMLPKRKHIFELYSNAFKNQNWAIVPTYENETKKSSYHVYTLRIKDVSEAQRDAIMQKVFEMQVSVNVHFIPLPMMSFYKSLGYKISDYPNAFKMYQNEISLPVYWDLSDDMVNTVIDAIISSVKAILD